MNTLKSRPIEEIGNLVSEGVIVVFDTMLKTGIAAAATPPPVLGATVVGSIGFVGDINGVVYVELPHLFARTLASRMLALPEDALDDAMVNDVVAEVSNMIVGSVKSQLCDSGSPCTLTIPSIVRGDNLKIERSGAAERLLLKFASENEPVLVEVFLKQP